MNNLMNRRAFLGSVTAIASERLFAAGRILESPGAPLLRFGVLSDIHLNANGDGTVTPKQKKMLKRWAQDNGAVFKTLAKYPKAISFSGHSHAPLENEDSLWRGAFTAVGTGSLCYLDYASCKDWKPDPPHPGRWNVEHGEGYLVSVYADRVVLARHEFVSNSPIGCNWEIPL